MLPAKYSIDYAALMSDAVEQSAALRALALGQQLLSLWQDVYLNTISHEANLVRFRHRTFEYICDLYSHLETMGSVAFDQTVKDRVVGVLGTSAKAQQPTPRRERITLDEELEYGQRDDGHFMARSIGGGVEMNLFSQDRRLNRGWSPQGKIYRRMERYCQEQQRIFCFSRPIYTDGSAVPRWLEFGVLKTDATLWLETFDN